MWGLRGDTRQAKLPSAMAQVAVGGLRGVGLRRPTKSAIVPMKMAEARIHAERQTTSDWGFWSQRCQAGTPSISVRLGLSSGVGDGLRADPMGRAYQGIVPFVIAEHRPGRPVRCKLGTTLSASWWKHVAFR